MTTDAIREQVRSEYEARFPAPRTERIERGRVRDYLLALDEPADLAADAEVPPLFLLTLGRTRRPQPSKGTAVKAGEDYEFFVPVRIGDTITINYRVLDVQEKQGKVGAMFLLTQEWRYVNQHGETVGVAKTTILRWGPL